MFKDRRLLVILCLLVLLAIVVSFLQTRPVELSGQSLRFRVPKNSELEVSFEGTVVSYSLDSIERFELVINGEEMYIYEDFFAFWQIHPEGPTQEKPLYSTWGTLVEEGSHIMTIKGGSSYVFVFEEYRPGEMYHIGDELLIEVRITPTFEGMVLIFLRNAGVSILIFGAVLLIVTILKRIDDPRKKRKILTGIKVFFLLSIISLLTILSLVEIQSREREYTVPAEADFVEFTVPSAWDMKIETDFWLSLYSESEDPFFFTMQEGNPSAECSSVGEIHYQAVGALFGQTDLSSYPVRNFIGERYIFARNVRICPGKYLWNLRGEKPYLRVYLGDQSEGELLIRVYPSKEAINQIIINNIKLVFMINILIISSIIIIPRIKFQKIE